MALSGSTPVEIQNPADTIPTGSATRDDSKLILTQNALPALETRIRRYFLDIDRVAAEIDRSIVPSTRWSTEILIGYLEDAAVQVAVRADSQFLAELITTKSPDFNGNWDFSDCIRILGGRITSDGTVKCQRVSEDQREDIESRSGLDATAPIYTLEGGKLNVYAGILTNPITANADAILLPTPTIKSAQATWVGSLNSLALTSGDTIEEDLHTLVNVSMSGITFPSAVGRGVLTSINQGAQTATLDVDENYVPLDGLYNIAWRSPAYSMMNESLEEAVVEMAAAYMFASIPDPQATIKAIERFEKIMESHGLNFFKI